MAKPRPKRVPSDDCAVWIDGEECRPHEGEWVDLVRSETVAELKLRIKFSRLGTDMDALRGDSEELSKINALWDAHYTEMAELLAERIFAWNWTDLRGRPLPPPADDEGRPLGLLKLRLGEMLWLLSATAPESEAERGNA